MITINEHPLQLVKTALLGRWVVANVRDGMIIGDGDEITPEQMEAVTVDFLKMKLDKYEKGFRFKNEEHGFRVTVEHIEV